MCCVIVLAFALGGGVTPGAPAAAAATPMPSEAFLPLLAPAGDATLVGDRCRGCCAIGIDDDVLVPDDIMVSLFIVEYGGGGEPEVW